MAPENALRRGAVPRRLGGERRAVLPGDLGKAGGGGGVAPQTEAPQNAAERREDAPRLLPAIELGFDGEAGELGGDRLGDGGEPGGPGIARGGGGATEDEGGAGLGRARRFSGVGEGMDD